MKLLEEIPRIDRAVWGMERTGIHVDTAFCESALVTAQHDEDVAWSSCQAFLGDNTVTLIGLPLSEQRTDEKRRGESPTGLVKYLARKKLKASPRWAKGVIRPGQDAKLDATALQWLRERGDEAWRPFYASLLELRRARSSIKYLTKLPTFINPTTGRVHPTYGSRGDDDDRIGALTGRLACKAPELQQMPKDKRKDKYQLRTFLTPQQPGHVILEIDYTALELYVFAHLVHKKLGDESMIDAILAGEDIHSIHVVKVFGELLGYPEARISPKEVKAAVPHLRDLIKGVWYGLMYGKGVYGFGHSLLDSSGNSIGEDAAQAILDALFTYRPCIPAFQDLVRRYVARTGRISSLSGRTADYSRLVNGEEWQQRAAGRKALNFPMQAGGADIVGRAMYTVSESALLDSLDFRLITQVHDALLLEGPGEHVEAAAAHVTGLMIDAGKHWDLALPLEAPAHWGANWYECGQ